MCKGKPCQDIMGHNINHPRVLGLGQSYHKGLDGTVQFHQLTKGPAQTIIPILEIQIFPDGIAEPFLAVYILCLFI